MFITGGSFSGHQIERSLRLRSGASTSASRTVTNVAQDTNQLRKTYSMWMKRGSLGSIQEVISNYTATSDFWGVFFDSSDRLCFVASQGGSLVAQKYSTAVFRDPTAWMHFLLVTDTANATGEDRVQLYVNGTRITAWNTNTIPAQNIITAAAFVAPAGGTWYLNIGNLANGTNYFDGYLAELVCVDGQALSPTAFGQFDSFGNWTAKRYSGSYGTNGFYLPFKDTSSTTNLVKDESGNGRNFTPYNISLTTGPTYDSMLDTPSNNYCVLNPLHSAVTTHYEGNLRAVLGASSAATSIGSIPMTSGKWYWEVYYQSGTTNSLMAGISEIQVSASPKRWQIAGTWNYWGNSGNKYNEAAADTSYGASYTSLNLLGFALDMDAGTLTCFKDGVSQGVMVTGLTGKSVAASFGNGTSGGGQEIQVNFGQRPFTYTPPAGFKTLCTANLPEPSIRNPKKHFDTLLWTSNTSVKNIGGVQFQPDLVWVKDRSNSTASEGWHHLVDSVRGAKRPISSNAVDAEYWIGLNNSVTAFNADGFASGLYDGLNGSAMVTWFWKAGGSTTTTNNAGSITAQVSVNPSAGFSIVTYTGSLTTTGFASIGHGLGVTPKMVISKSRNVAGSDGGSWMLQHVSLGTDDFLYLNSTSAAIDAVSTGGGQLFKPTSDVFYSTWNSGGALSGNNYVAYCFAEIPGFSRFGSYTGGDANPRFVHCGFRPRFVMIKRVTGAENWYMYDSMRNTYNQMNTVLEANLSNADGAGDIVDFVSNGFVLRSNSVATNSSTDTYIFAAFAEAPFKYANAR